MIEEKLEKEREKKKLENQEPKPRRMFGLTRADVGALCPMEYGDE